MSNADRILEWCERMENNLLHGSNMLTKQRCKRVRNCPRGAAYFCDGRINYTAGVAVKNFKKKRKCKHYIDNRCTYGEEEYKK